jgi:hypothetical protein
VNTSSKIQRRGAPIDKTGPSRKNERASRAINLFEWPITRTREIYERIDCCVVGFGLWRILVYSTKGDSPVDPSDLIKVYTLTNAPQAEIIKTFLEEEGIRCFLDGEEAGSLGLSAFEINVMVPAGDADRARKLIESHEPGKTE